jgi:hypothetical protein
MTSTGLLRLALVASIALASGPARADDDIVVRADSKNIAVTEPEADSAVLRGAMMSVEGTVKVGPDAEAPAGVVATFTSKGEQKVQLGSYGLRLGDEENEYGVYQLKDDAYQFRFKISAPKQAGECELVVETIGGGARGRKITKERSKPIAINVR